MLMIGIRQFFTRQNFPNPDSSKFSTVKILRHTVIKFHSPAHAPLTTPLNRGLLDLSVLLDYIAN